MPLPPDILYRSESESLDFKRDPYPFEGQDDRKKSELLKDILAMANSWRGGSAFILIGVEEDGPPSRVVGTHVHLDDATLQQFVNTKTNRPITFSYTQAQMNGLPIGIFEIPVQQRPIFLKKDYGKLKSNTVYIRRGSATAEASPDEIAMMGATSTSLRENDLELAFACVGDRKTTGTTLNFNSTLVRVTEEPNIPKLSSRNTRPGEFLFFPDRINSSYFREVVDYVKAKSFFVSTSITVKNGGAAAAKEIRAELVLDDPTKRWHFATEAELEMPVPKRKKTEFASLIRSPAIDLRREPSCRIAYVGNAWHLDFEFRNLQPGRTLWPAIEFYVGSFESNTAQLQGQIMAENLPYAVSWSLELKSTVSERKIDLQGLIDDFENSKIS